jgi:putative ABC transport system permease protein
MSQTGEKQRVRLHVWLIRFIGVIVPRRFRIRFRQEWEAELEYREELLARWDRLDWRNKLVLLWRSLGAFWDALWLQQLRWEDEMIQDLRFGVRLLLKHKGFTVVAALTLALGIGANTAIFSVVNSVLLRPLNYKDSDRLVWVSHHYKKINQNVTAPGVAYLHYRNNSKSFENIGASVEWAVNLTGTGDPERLNGRAVTHTFFPTLGVEAARGRAFTQDDNQPGRNRVVALTDSLWRRRFAADPDIVGKAIILNGENYTVLGVMPPGFQFGREFGQAIDIYSPIEYPKEPPDDSYWDDGPFFVIARLKRDAPLEQAQAEMDTFADTIRRQYMRGHTKDPSVWGIALLPLRKMVVGDIQRPLFTLMAAVGFVLLIACANVANLLLARAAARQKEIAIRSALGAGRWRVIRQLLTESALLALIGGGLGLLFAYWGMRSLLALNENFIPRAYEVGIDGRALAFTFGVSLLTGLLFGLAPALHSSKTELQETLKEGGRGVLRTRGRLRSSLMVFEVTSTLVLLIGAGLLIKSFWRVQEVNPGFDPNNLLAMRLSLPDTKYKEPAQIDSLFQRILTGVNALPGVKSAGLSSTIPMSGINPGATFRIEGRESAPGENLPNGLLLVAGASYFQTMNIPLIRGRYFDDHDVPGAPSAAILDETMTRKYWPNENPIGKRIWWYERDPQGNKRWREIVGVVSSVRHHHLDEELGPKFYIPLRQFPFPAQSVFLVIRAAAEPESMIAAARGVIQSADKDLPINRVMTVERMLAESTPQRRFTTILLGVFALIALILASVGLFGVMSYTVAQRTHEIGIRMALGASKANILKLVIFQGLAFVAAGIPIGLGVAYLLTRLISGMLFGVSPTDWLTFTLLPFFLASVALAACYIPARRATKVDPMVALRHD